MDVVALDLQLSEFLDGLIALIALQGGAGEGEGLGGSLWLVGGWSWW